MFLLKSYFINTTDEVDVISIIHEINRTVSESNITDGLVTVVVPAPGGALAIIEPLPDIVSRLKEALRVFPGEGTQTKNRRKEEIEVGPRVVSAMIGKSVQIPVSGGKLVLGLREEVILIDLEKKGRRREFVVQVMWDKPDAKCASQQSKALPAGR